MSSTGPTIAATVSDAAEPQHPYPLRYRHLKRWLWISLVVAIVIAGLRLWWGHEASKRLNARLDALRQQGIPILPADFNRPPIRDEENAAYFIQQAIGQRDPATDAPAETAMIYPGYPPFPPEWHRLISNAVKANTSTLEYLRTARDCRRVEWNLQFTTPIGSVPIPVLSGSRGLANLAGDAALEAHTRGDDAAALDYVRDVRALGDAIGEQPVLVSHLVSLGIHAVANDRLQVIAAALNVSGSGSTEDPGSADRRVVEELIRDLLNDQVHRSSLHRGLQGERMMLVDAIRWHGQKLTILQPLVHLNAAHVLDETAGYDEAPYQADAASAEKKLPPVRKHSGVFDASRLPSLPFMFPMGRATDTSFRVMTENRLSAVSLAIRLYRLDHGQYPDSLDSLVPDYLPEVPRDPMASDGRPLRYLLAANRKRPVVYSVGPNGQDETVDESMLPAAPAYNWQNARGRSDDQHRDLSRWAPPPSASNAPASEEAD